MTCLELTMADESSVVAEPAAHAAHAAGSEDRLRQLLAQVEVGRLDALAGIWRLCARELYGLALWRSGSAEDAADAVQEVFVRLATTRARLDRVRRPRAYLLRMAHACVVDLLRRRRLGPAPEELQPELLVAVVQDPDRGAEASRLSRHLTALPASQREAVYLRHFGELSFRQIGRITRVPTFTAASRYRLGIGRLRRLMGVEP